MRVLVALDGSEPGDLARELVANLTWPPDTTLRLVSVAPDLFAMPAGPFPEAAPPITSEIEARVVDGQRQMLEAAGAKLTGQGQRVETFVRRGRPATAIVAEASAFGADLVVLGARGHSTLSAVVLGSVSEEVVSHAPCPVLVARTPRVERILLADDGSEGASRARRFLVQWRPFGRVPIRIVSVASAPAPWQSGVSPMLMGAALDAYDDSLRESRDRLEAAAKGSVEELADVAAEATVDVRAGDPSREVVAAAAEWQADLIVTGSRGLSGIRSVLLGSVARNVLHHAPCSVLVVRAVQPEGMEDGSTSAE